MPSVNATLELAGDDKETKWTITTVFTLLRTKPDPSANCEKQKRSLDLATGH